MTEFFPADVVDAEEQARRRREERRVNSKVAHGTSYRDRSKSGADTNVDAATPGVTVNWLATVFNMQAVDVKRRLANCPALHRRQAGFVYDLKTACSFLVKPQINIDDYLKNMKIEELPPRLQTEYWNAKNKRLKFEEDAGHLWRTEAVMALVGMVVQQVRTQTRLWADEIEREESMTERQRALMQKKADALLSTIYDECKSLKMKRVTKSVLMEFLDEERIELLREEEERQAAAALEMDTDDDGFDPLSLI